MSYLNQYKRYFISDPARLRIQMTDAQSLGKWLASAVQVATCAAHFSLR
jgi:hypothetical protein